MSLTIEIQTGELAGRRKWLNKGQQIVVGRTDISDLVVREDRTMSERHFEIHCDFDGGRLRDVGSRNGTFLNGKKVTEAIVHDGDEITAGGSRFMVHLKSTSDSEADPTFSSAELEAMELNTESLDQPVPEASTIQHLSPKSEPKRLPSAEPLDQVVLETWSELMSRRKVWIRPGQVFHVGRVGQADLVVPLDGQMSRMHFVVECDRSGCWVRDNGSSNGTFVNGDRITEALLRDGDKIQAGNSIFRVSIRWGEGSQVIESDAPSVRKAANESSSRKQPIEYSTHRCPSSLCAFTGCTPAKPRPILNRIAPECPVRAIIDRGKIGLDPPESTLLFAGLSGGLDTTLSPVLISSEHSAFWTMVDKAWGKDALVLVLSDYDDVELRSVLCDAVRDESDSDSAATIKLRRFSSPKVLSMILSHSGEDSLRKLQGIDAILLESDRSWQLYAREDFEKTMHTRGFVNPE